VLKLINFMNYKKNILAAMALTLLLVGTQALAGNNDPLPSTLGTININDFAARIINYILGLIGSIALILFVYGGFLWMTSAGRADAVKNGQKIIVWATIGMAVVFTSYILVKFFMEGVIGVG